RAGYANEPTNDMAKVDVPPLAPEDARGLAEQLLKAEAISTGDIATTAAAIADAVDNIPFFIHHIVDQIALYHGGAASPALAPALVQGSLTAPPDPWDLPYYRRRIHTYYSPEQHPFALGLLDALSAADQSLPFGDLFNRLKSHTTTEDTETAREVLTLLE